MKVRRAILNTAATWLLVCIFSNKVKCEAVTTTSSTSTTIAPPASSVTNVNSLSSSSSSEDQLTPLLLSSGSGSPASHCVNCPQTVCTLSKVSYSKATIHYNWRVDGLPDYIAYLEKFQTQFELSNDVSFNATPPNNGNWSFSLSRQNHGPLELRVTYKYTTTSRSPPKLAYDLGLSAHVEDESVALPSQISSQATLTGMMPTSPYNFRSPIENMTYSWTYLFIWSDIQSKMVTLMEAAGLESQSVEFKFIISSYQHEDPATGSNTDCANWNEDSRTSSPYHHHHHHHHGGFEPNPNHNSTWPPFLHHMYTLMKDDKYADLVIRSGDEEFKIHRVIAAYSSPVLATMIFNKTYDKSESLIDFGEEIGSDVVEELIRYMYTGRVEEIEEIADRLIVASTKYGFPALKKLCESALIKQVKTENAFSMYALGAEVGSTRLKRRAFNIMKENKSKIVAQSEEFRKLSVHHPDVMYELFLS